MELNDAKVLIDKRDFEIKTLQEEKEFIIKRHENDNLMYA